MKTLTALLAVLVTTSLAAGDFGTIQEHGPYGSSHGSYYRTPSGYGNFNIQHPDGSQTFGTIDRFGNFNGQRQYNTNPATPMTPSDWTLHQWRY